MRALLASLLVVLAAVPSRAAAKGVDIVPPAAAPDGADAQKQACADAYDNSQVLRDQGQIDLARAQLEVCQKACPEVLARDCRRWRAELEVAPSEDDGTRHLTATFATGEDDGVSGSAVAAAVLAALGGAALVVGGALAIKGHVDRGDLFDCRPHCAQEDVDAVASTWTAAGVVAAAGAATAGAALLVWLLADPGSAVPGDVEAGAHGLVVRF